MVRRGAMGVAGRHVVSRTSILLYTHYTPNWSITVRVGLRTCFSSTECIHTRVDRAQASNEDVHCRLPACCEQKNEVMAMLPLRGGADVGTRHDTRSGVMLGVAWQRPSGNESEDSGHMPARVRVVPDYDLTLMFQQWCFIPLPYHAHLALPSLLPCRVQKMYCGPLQCMQ